jgi:hypothetical protein
VQHLHLLLPVNIVRIQTVVFSVTQCSLVVDTNTLEEHAASVFRVGKSIYEIYFHSNECLDHSLVDVMPYSMEDGYQCYRGTCDTPLQGNHDCMPEDQS